MKELKYNFGAIKKLFETYKVDLLNVDLSDFNPVGITEIYWAGRLHEDKDLTLEKAESELFDMNPLDVVSGVKSALESSFKGAS